MIKLVFSVLVGRKSIEDMYTEGNTILERLGPVLQEKKSTQAGRIAAEIYPEIIRFEREQIIPNAYIRETREWMNAVLSARTPAQLYEVVRERVRDTLDGHYAARFSLFEVDSPAADLIASLKSGDGRKSLEILEKAPFEQLASNLPPDDETALVHTIVTDDGTFAVVTQRAHPKVVLCPSATRERVANMLRGWMWLYYWHSVGIYERTLDHIAEKEKMRKEERAGFEEAAWRIPYQLISENEHIIRNLHPTAIPSTDGKPSVPFLSWILMEVILQELGAGYCTPDIGLWKRLWQELAAGGTRRMILCSDRALALFPHHAAILNITEDGQKDFLLDHCELTYLPQGALASTHYHPIYINRLVVAGDENLPLSATGVLSVRDLSRQQRQTNMDVSNFYALRSALVEADAFTFVGHAHYDWDRPEDSYLQMTDRRMRLKRFLDAVSPNLKLVTLAACGIGLPETRSKASDYKGFAEDLLLKAGVPVVASTLWPVHQFSTILLMRAFHRDLLNPPSSDEGRYVNIAAALRRAQQWLRSLTVQQVVEELRSLASLTNAEEIRREIENTRKQRLGHPYAHPYFWAPFYVMGGAR